jgi:hypothetical protein
MAFSLLPDVMGSREKLQLALWANCRDTRCIEMPAGFDGLSSAETPITVEACAVGQQKAPDRSGAH